MIINILKNKKIKLSKLSDTLYKKNYQTLVNLKTKKDPEVVLKKLILMI